VSKKKTKKSLSLLLFVWFLMVQEKTNTRRPYKMDQLQKDQHQFGVTQSENGLSLSSHLFFFPALFFPVQFNCPIETLCGMGWMVFQDTDCYLRSKGVGGCVFFSGGCFSPVPNGK